MKCPDCRFVSSDDWDICPRCHVDLRPHKQLLRIPIKDRHSTHESLIKKLALDPAQKKPGQPTNVTSAESFSNWLRKFLGFEARSKEPAPFIAVPEVQPVSELPDEAQPQTASPPPQDIIFQIFDEVIATPFSSPSAQTDTSVGQTPANPGRQELSAQSAQPASAHENSPLNSLLTAMNDQSSFNNPLGLLSEADLGSAPDQMLAGQSADRPAAANIAGKNEELTSRLAQTMAEPAAVDQASLNGLFDAAVRDVVLSGNMPVSEFDAAQLILDEDIERSNLLFDLAQDFLKNPATSIEYSDSLTSSDQRAVASEQLSQELKAAEDALTRPVFSLKGSSRLPDKSPLNKATASPNSCQASGPTRVLAQTIDVLLALAISVCLIVLKEFGAIQRAAEPWSIAIGLTIFAENLPVLFLTGAILLVSIEFVSAAFSLPTLGQRATGTRTTLEDGSPVWAVNAVFRAVLLCASVICGIFFIELLVNRPLYERLSRTKLVKG